MWAFNYTPLQEAWMFHQDFLTIPLIYITLFQEFGTLTGIFFPLRPSEKLAAVSTHWSQ